LEKDFTVDNRVKVNNEKNISWFHRTTARFQDFRLGFIGVIDITNKELIKKDLLLGYKKDDFDISVKAEQAFDMKPLYRKDWKKWFSKYVLTGVYQRTKKEKYGVEVVADPWTEKVVATGLVEYNYSDNGFTKLKFDSNLNLTLLVKKTLTDKLSLSFGAWIPKVTK